MLTPSHAFCIRKSAGEALTGARAGQVLSRERKIQLRGADGVVWSGRQHGIVRYCENVSAPAWSETLCTYGSYLRGSREIPLLALGDGPRSAL